jgi:predicted RNase H-like HicB family nuclease
MTSSEYTVIIEPAEDGTFSVYVPDLPGCISTGATREEAIDSIREAIAGHIQTLKDLGEPVPPPRSQSQVVAA